MRAISLVQRLEFEFHGNVVRNALTLGDVDNDGCNELVVGNAKGEVAIFKGTKRLQSISKLSFISCLAVGDVFNQNRNSLIIVTADGWCYIYETPDKIDLQDQPDQPDGSQSGSSKDEIKENLKLECVHEQRLPANAKNILLGDIDGDGMIEMVLGLTDRVVRSYRWLGNSDSVTDSLEKSLGKFIALNKWECANQIGSVTLHHSNDGQPELLIAQPGGTFMRIRCQCEDNLSQCLNSSEHSTTSSQSEHIPGSVDYQFLGLSRMRNQNISTEILGDLQSLHNYDKSSISSSTTQKTSESVKSGRPYAVATLDGTIMLVQDEVIIWAMAVDHQVFALTKLDVSGNGIDDIVACSWDGQTYILDQEKNAVRFQLDEPVQAFDSGYYNLGTNSPDVTCFVYVTFKNTIILYYDIPLKEFTCKRFEPNIDSLSKLFIDENRSSADALELVKGMNKKTKSELVEYLLYNLKS